MLVIRMKKIITSFLFLIILITLTIPANAKASNEIEVRITKVDIIKRNPDLVITGCNETYVYWEYNYRIFDPPIAIRDILSNETKYLNKLSGDYYSETLFIIDVLSERYDIKNSIWFHAAYFQFGIQAELENYEKRLLKEREDLGIFYIETATTVDYEKLVIRIYMYKITPEKVNFVVDSLKPFVNFLRSYIKKFSTQYNITFGNKYDVILAFIEAYQFNKYIDDPTLYPFFVKQRDAVSKFISFNETSKNWSDGIIKYLKLLKEYYNFEIPVIYSMSHGYGAVDLPIPINATYNEEFVKKAVAIVREYTGCEVPLVVNFMDYRKITQITLLSQESINNNLKQENMDENFFENVKASPSLSINELLLFFVVIPILIFLPLILIARKKAKMVKSKK
jgi:hypothetical protein